MKRLRATHALLLAVLAAGCVENDPFGVERPDIGAPRYAIPPNWNGNIRIGVVPTASTITLGSTGDFTIIEKTSGAALVSGNNDAASITMTSPAVTKWYVQVACASGAGLDALLDKVVADGHPYTLELAPIGCQRVLLGDFLATDPFAERNAFRLLLLDQGYPADLFPTTRVVSIPTFRVELGATVVTSTDVPVVTSPSGIITINGAPYRGVGEVRGNSAGSIAGINELPIEQYLYGVVPRELGPVAYPEIEAQKAQAVAARTYALRGLGKRAVDGYDLLATTTDQVYGGYAAEHPVSNAAVDATHGLAITYEGDLIDALYSSTSGGHTADSEESFSAVVPYLRGVVDSEKNFKMKDGEPTALRKKGKHDYEADWASFHRWAFEWTPEEMRAVLSSWQGSDVGTVHAINVLERGPSGRVLTLEYVTDAGTFTASKATIRSSLRFYNANGELTNLPSTLFFIEPIQHNKHEPITGWEVYGAGFGHGVGIAQTGAVGMAERGYSFEQILRHYYTGVDLTTMY